MGRVIQGCLINSSKFEGFMRPIIYCAPDPKTVNDAISINILMAKRLSEVRPKRRSMQMGVCFEDVISELSNDVVIKDFDVMFNPDYRVDVLQIFIVACKKKPFRLIWPGKYRNGKLIYAEEGYMDYKEFDVEYYDVTCIV